MANLCLVTKLQETIEDDSLMRLDELRFPIEKKGSATSSTDTITINMITSEPVTLELIKSGYFLDASEVSVGTKFVTGTGNVTVKATLTAEGYFSIVGKSKLTSLGLFSRIAGGSAFILGAVNYSLVIPTNYLDVVPLKGIVLSSTVILDGDIALINTDRLEVFSVSSNDRTTGSINKIFAKGLYRISFTRAKYISGDFSFLMAENLTHFDMRKSNVKGDLSDCDFKHIDSWSFISYDNLDTENGFSPSGNICASVRNNAKSEFNNGLQRLWVKSLSGLYGNLGLLPNSIILMSNVNGSSLFTYAKSANRTYILALDWIRISSGADDFLIDMSKLAISPSATQGYEKTINIYANVTSASESAIATLQSKGVTVIIRALPN